jgi:ribosomal protein S4
MPPEIKKSSFGESLTERRKLSMFYGGLKTYTIKKLISKAKEKRGNPSTKLLLLLESRLDVVVYRTGFVESVNAAHQWVIHGKVLVNGNVMKHPNYELRPGDVIEVLPEARTEAAQRKMRLFSSWMGGRVDEASQYTGGPLGLEIAGTVTTTTKNVEAEAGSTEAEQGEGEGGGSETKDEGGRADKVEEEKVNVAPLQQQHMHSEKVVDLSIADSLNNPSDARASQVAGWSSSSSSSSSSKAKHTIKPLLSALLQSVELKKMEKQSEAWDTANDENEGDQFRLVPIKQQHHQGASLKTKKGTSSPSSSSKGIWNRLWRRYLQMYPELGVWDKNNHIDSPSLSDPYKDMQVNLPATSVPAGIMSGTKPYLTGRVSSAAVVGGGGGGGGRNNGVGLSGGLRRAMHLEVNYATGMAVYLYPPQRLYYPCTLDVESLTRGFYR